MLGVSLARPVPALPHHTTASKPFLLLSQAPASPFNRHPLHSGQAQAAAACDVPQAAEVEA